MTSGSRIAARSLAAVMGVVAGIGCAEPPGELVLVVQTDLSLPEDIDTIRIEISRDGIPKYKDEFSALGLEGSILLPATLGVVPSEDAPDATATIRVSARSQGVTRVLREVITPIPGGKVSTLHVPMEFLCVGSAQPLLDAEDNAVNTCPDGFTCKAGRCVESALTEEEIESLPEYAATAVFGGGTGQRDGDCIDVAWCFQEPTLLPIDDMEGCTLAAPEGDFNLALLSGTEGMCNGDDCFVALSAGIESGWTRLPDGRIQLPRGVCDPQTEFLVGPRTLHDSVAIAPISSDCPGKDISIPTCGPWSSAGGNKGGLENQPLKLVSRQESPIGLAFDGESIYWTVSGSFADRAARPGKIVRQRVAGGPPEELENALTDVLPRQIILDPGSESVFVALQDVNPPATGQTRNRIWRFTYGPVEDPAARIRTIDLTGAADTRKIEGLTVSGDRLFWTDFGSGRVYMAGLDGQGVTPLQAPLPGEEPGRYHPFRIAARGDAVCWTNEGTFEQQNGSVRCASISQPSMFSEIPGQRTPRGISLDDTHVYWTTFEDGGVWRAERTAAGLGAPTPVAQDQYFPYGIVVDQQAVYWTNWGEGTVRMLEKDSITGDGMAMTTLLAEAQLRPGTIHLVDRGLYWINEGVPEEAGGAVVQLELPGP